MRALRVVPLAVLLAASACIGPEDSPSTVHDLRVLGVSLDPPELMRRPSSCLIDPIKDPVGANVIAWAEELEYRALIVDPAGAGRSLDYKLWGCADIDDRACEEENDRVVLAEGTTTEGELVLRIRPTLAQLPPRTPGGDPRSLLIETASITGQQGLAALWLPLVLELHGGEEEVRAQKLLVLTCAWFPESAANLQPVLPGIVLRESIPFPEGEVMELTGAGPFPMKPADFAALEEPYVLPSLTAFPPEPVQLTESWKVAWYTDFGGFSPNQTGGADASGGTGRHNVEWIPENRNEERDVRFWFVVRDGRGGLSWTTRQARYRP